jgi:hypothetical protein
VGKVVRGDPVTKIGRQQKGLTPIAVDKFAHHHQIANLRLKVRQTAMASKSFDDPAMRQHVLAEKTIFCIDLLHDDR